MPDLGLPRLDDFVLVPSSCRATACSVVGPSYCLSAEYRRATRRVAEYRASRQALGALLFRFDRRCPTPITMEARQNSRPGISIASRHHRRHVAPSRWAKRPPPPHEAPPAVIISATTATGRRAASSPARCFDAETAFRKKVRAIFLEKAARGFAIESTPHSARQKSLRALPFRRANSRQHFLRCHYRRRRDRFGHSASHTFSMRATPRTIPRLRWRSFPPPLPVVSRVRAVQMPSRSVTPLMRAGAKAARRTRRARRIVYRRKRQRQQHLRRFTTVYFTLHALHFSHRLVLSHFAAQGDDNTAIRHAGRHAAQRSAGRSRHYHSHYAHHHTTIPLKAY